MTKQELIDKLEEIRKQYGGDYECAHSDADDALVEFINDADIEEAYNKIGKWYA